MRRMIQMCAVTMVIIAGLMLMVSCSSSDPQSQLQTIAELQGKGFPMTDEQKSDVDAFVAQGKDLVQQGKVEAASEALGQAIDILNAALDADLFNKAD